MTLLIIAYLFYLVGFIGALIEGAGEFWLWFLALGVVLDITLVLLAYLDSPTLSFIKESSKAAKASHILALLLTGLATYLRLKAEISWFFLLLGIILILWSYSNLNLHNTWRRKSQNE